MELILRIRRTIWKLSGLSFEIKGPNRTFYVSPKTIRYDSIKVSRKKAEKAIAEHFARALVAEQARIDEARKDGTDIYGFVERMIYIPKEENEIKSEQANHWNKDGIIPSVTPSS